MRASRSSAEVRRFFVSPSFFFWFVFTVWWYLHTYNRNVTLYNEYAKWNYSQDKERKITRTLSPVYIYVGMYVYRACMQNTFLLFQVSLFVQMSNLTTIIHLVNIEYNVRFFSVLFLFTTFVQREFQVCQNVTNLMKAHDLTFRVLYISRTVPFYAENSQYLFRREFQRALEYVSISAWYLFRENIRISKFDEANGKNTEKSITSKGTYTEDLKCRNLSMCTYE